MSTGSRAKPPMDLARNASSSERVEQAHASIQITTDRYGHLMPGSEAESAELLDRYLLAKTS